MTAKSKTLRHPFRPRPLNKNETRKIATVLERYYDQIDKLYQSQDWVSHAKTVHALLRFARKIPVYHLKRFDAKLIDQIHQSGIRPLLSYVIDYAFRLLYQRDEESFACYKSLMSAFKKSNKRKEMKGPTIIVMRSRSYAYRLHSENVGWVVARLIFSKFGEEQVVLGYQPETFLRIIALLDSCQQKQKAEENKESVHSKIKIKRTLSQGIDTCKILSDKLLDKLGQSDMDDVQSIIDDFTTNGFQSGISECIESLAADRNETEFADRMESYLGCRNAVQSGPRDITDWFADNANIDTRGNITFGERPIYSKGRIDENGRFTDSVYRGYGKDGTDAIMRRYGYEGGPITVEIQNLDTGAYSKTVFNKDGSKDFERRDGQGNSVSGHVNPNGTWGNTRQVENLGGGVKQTTEVGRDSNGNVQGTKITVETTDENGNTTTQTFEYDANGNEVKSSSSNAQTTSPIPGDDFVSDPCANLLFDDPRDAQFSDRVTKMETLINPAPDYVQPMDDPCFDSFQGSQQSTCTSVWLCLDAQVDEDCRCNPSSDGVILIDNDACTQITCAEGTECDAQTGLCKSLPSAEGPFFEPGVGPPNPPTELFQIPRYELLLRGISDISLLPLDADVPSYFVSSRRVRK